MPGPVPGPEDHAPAPGSSAPPAPVPRSEPDEYAPPTRRAGRGGTGYALRLPDWDLLPPTEFLPRHAGRR